MSGAERQRRYLDRQVQSALAQAKAAPDTALKARIAELEAELAQAKQRYTRAEIGLVGLRRALAEAERKARQAQGGKTPAAAGRGARAQD